MILLLLIQQFGGLFLGLCSFIVLARLAGLRQKCEAPTLKQTQHHV